MIIGITIELETSRCCLQI